MTEASHEHLMLRRTDRILAIGKMAECAAHIVDGIKKNASS
jgi:hypothetical protein